MEIKMKCRLFLLTITGAVLITACVPTTSGVEEQDIKVVVETPEIQSEVKETVSKEMESTLGAISNGSDMVEVSFSLDVWPILEKYALAVHGGKGGVFLESYADIMNYVEPKNPEDSLLYRALIGEGMKQMSPGNPLPDEMIQIIYDS
jgi:hypothetical protein